MDMPERERREALRRAQEEEQLASLRKSDNIATIEVLTKCHGKIVHDNIVAALKTAKRDHGTGVLVYAAKLLGISRHRLTRLMKKHGVPRQPYTSFR